MRAQPAKFGASRISTYTCCIGQAASRCVETMRALGDLVHAGKTRFVGVSNFDVDDMLEARALLEEIPLACNQVLYHLDERRIEHRLIPAAAAAGIAIVAYTPFGRGKVGPRPQEHRRCAACAYCRQAWARRCGK